MSEMRRGNWLIYVLAAKRPRRLAGLLVLLMLPWTPAQGQTLHQALIGAYRNNPELQAERANLRATDEGVPQAIANWRPNVSLSGDIARTHTHLTSRGGDRTQTRTPRGVGLDITQSLFRGFRTQAATNKAENAVFEQRQTLIAKEQDILLDAVEAYAAVFRDQAVLELNVNNEQVLARQLQATRDRFRVGEITRTDVSQAEARLAGARADRVKAEGDLEKSRANYRNVVGASPGRLADPGRPSKLPATLSDSISRAKSQHPDVRGAEFERRQALDAVKSVKGELLPSVNLSGSLARDDESASNVSRAFSASLKLALTVPLYQKGAVFSRLREAKQDAGKSVLDLENAKRDSVETATKAWESLQTAGARIKSFSAQIKASEIALEGVQREASVGSRTVLDVLDAEQELLDAKVNLVRAQRDDVVASFELLEATGMLTAGKIGLPVKIYDPRLHYRQVRDKWIGTGAEDEGGPAAPKAGSDG